MRIPKSHSNRKGSFWNKNQIQKREIQRTIKVINEAQKLEDKYQREIAAQEYDDLPIQVKLPWEPQEPTTDYRIVAMIISTIICFMISVFILLRK